MQIDYTVIDTRAAQRKLALERLSRKLDSLPSQIDALKECLKFLSDLSTDTKNLDTEGREMLTYELTQSLITVGEACQSMLEGLGTTNGNRSTQRLLDLLGKE